MLLLSSLSPCLFVPVGKKSCSFLLIYFHLCAIIVWISIWNIFSFFLVSFYRGGFLALSLTPKPEGGLSFFCHGSPFLRWLSFRVNRCPSNQVWNQSFPYPKTGLLVYGYKPHLPEQAGLKAPAKWPRTSRICLGSTVASMLV